MIDIVMATYNGEKFIREQLDSIFSQTFDDWRLIVSDDCSNDETVNIVKEYQQKSPNKILLIENQKPSGSAQNNFFGAVKFVTADYIMFSDQDDVWLSQKIEETFNVMKQIEAENGSGLPILVHTDLEVVDDKLNVINKSIFDMQNMGWRRCSLNNLLVQNIVTGCTVMVNKKLLHYLQITPKHSIMHDMWMALIASAFGKIGFLNKSTILYRQHEKNANGAKEVKSISYFIQSLFQIRNINNNLVNKYAQAKEFRDCFFTDLSKRQVEMLDAYGDFENKNILERFLVLKEYNMFRNSLIQVIGQIFI